MSLLHIHSHNTRTHIHKHTRSYAHTHTHIQAQTRTHSHTLEHTHICTLRLNDGKKCVRGNCNFLWSSRACSWAFETFNVTVVCSQEGNKETFGKSETYTKQQQNDNIQTTTKWIKKKLKCLINLLPLRHSRVQSPFCQQQGFSHNNRQSKSLHHFHNNNSPNQLHRMLPGFNLRNHLYDDESFKKARSFSHVFKTVQVFKTIFS